MSRYILSSVQQKAVDQLVAKYNDLETKDKVIVDFQAPTGAGKTFIITNVINEIINNNRNQGSPRKLIFVIATLSSAELPLQLENNLLEYKQHINGLFNVKWCESPSSSKTKLEHYPDIPVEENNVIIFGKQSAGKKKILTEQGFFDRFLDEIKTKNYTLVYIRDEAHHGGEVSKNNNLIDYDMNMSQERINVNKSKSFEFSVQNAASYIIKMTATPKGNNELIYINEKDLKQDDILLLKDNAIHNEGLSNNSEIDDIDMLEVACKKFRYVLDEYAKNNEELKNISPAMLIQVRNEPSDKHEKEIFEQEINKIIAKLEEHNLSWVKYFSSDKIDSKLRLDSGDINQKVNLKEISKDTSDHNVILFKIGPSTGWNIPRACMLVQLRNVSSDTLSVQTLGRIKRFPNPEYSRKYMDKIPEKAISRTYWIYTNLNDVGKTRFTLTLKKQYEKEKFISGSINADKHKEGFNKHGYKAKILDELSKSRIVNEFNKYVEEYKAKNYLVTEYITTNNSEGGIVSRIKSMVTNSIELETYIETWFVKNAKLFPDTLREDIIKSIFAPSISNENSQISIYMFWFIIIQKYEETIKIIYSDFVEIARNDLDLYNLEYMYSLPKNNETFLTDAKLDNPQLKVKLNKSNNYAYEDLRENEHYFDSYSEGHFADDLFKYIEKNHLNEKVKVWSKNPVFHGLNFQYIDTNNEIKNSYPDFLIDVIDTDGKTHKITVEVKNLDNDYDKDKTTTLIDAYQKYLSEDKIDNIRRSQESLNIASISIMICYAHFEKNIFKDYYFVGTSTLKDLSEWLNIGDNVKQAGDLIKQKNSRITDLETLFSYFK
ncbi:DEAD/DEAH box helicase family protein [Mycoplasmopsis mucosicanis]|nr:DEAD/DEAH box helicase family protein [Mycoplasmopsis mucosicanis]